MTYRFVIRRTLPGLNDCISAERSSRFQAASMKKHCEWQPMRRNTITSWLHIVRN